MSTQQPPQPPQPQEDNCYLCIEPATNDNPFCAPSPCLCTGTMQIHRECLQTIMKQYTTCPVCKFEYDAAYNPRHGLSLIVERELYDPCCVYQYYIDKQRQKQGICKTYKGGALVAIERYEDDVLEGKAIYYWSDNTVQKKTHYKAGLIHGEEHTYSPRGQLESMETYEHGVMHGRSVTYYSSGAIQSIGTYVEGKRNGAYIIYYPNGQTSMSLTFIDNKENGAFWKWTESGQLISKGNWNDETKAGTIYRYNRTDCKYKAMTYRDNKLVHVWWPAIMDD